MYGDALTLQAAAGHGKRPGRHHVAPSDFWPMEAHVNAQGGGSTEMPFKRQRTPYDGNAETVSLHPARPGAQWQGADLGAQGGVYGNALQAAPLRRLK